MNGKNQNTSDYYLHRYEGYVAILHFIGASSMNLTFSLSKKQASKRNGFRGN